MKKPSTIRKPPEMLPEYDFRGGIRGKYAERYRRGVRIEETTDLDDQGGLPEATEREPTHPGDEAVPDRR